MCISPAGRRSSPRGSGPPGGPPEGTHTLHFIPIVIIDDDDEGENEAVDPTTATPSRSTTKKLGTEKILPQKMANDTSKQNKNNANNVPMPDDDTEKTRTR